jgi:FkbM family methyltransferase
MSQTRLREVISSRSLLPYLAWRAGLNGRSDKQVRLTSGEKVILRPPPTNDLGNAMEVFLFSIYESPRRLPGLQRIVDLGANVGYSVVYFAHRFPAAEIVAWEPHPDHVRQLTANVTTNCLEHRVSIYPVAAGSRNETKWLIDQGTSSHVVDEHAPNSIRIDVRDWLEHAHAQPIDLLKVDIEGGEYDLLFDPRFGELNVSRLVVECHCNPARLRGDEEIAARLRVLGYEVSAGHVAYVDGQRVAMLWGFRQ